MEIGPAGRLKVGTAGWLQVGPSAWVQAGIRGRLRALAAAWLHQMSFLVDIVWV